MIMKCGRLAQSVEQGTENPRVPSSILGPATIFFASKTLKITLRGSQRFFMFPKTNYGKITEKFSREIFIFPQRHFSENF